MAPTFTKYGGRAKRVSGYSLTDNDLHVPVRIFPRVYEAEKTTASAATVVHGEQVFQLRLK